MDQMSMDFIFERRKVRHSISQLRESTKNIFARINGYDGKMERIAGKKMAASVLL